MFISRALILGLTAIVIGVMFSPGERAGAVAPVPAGQNLAPNQIATSKPDKNGLVTVLRPIATHLSPGDPLRIVVHLATEKGPITIDHPLGKASVWADETFASLTFRITAPDGTTHTLKHDFKPAALPKGVNPHQSLFEVATQIITLNDTGPTRNSVQTATYINPLPIGFTNTQTAKWTEKPKFSFDTPGKYAITVTGTVTPAGGAPIPFESASLSVERVPDRFAVPSQAELTKRFRDAATKEYPDLKLTPDTFVMEDKGGGRVVRFRAEPPAPKNNGGGIVIAGGFEFSVFTGTVKADGTLGKPVATKVFACVAAGTKLESEKGAVAIETVRVGDRVWGYDTATAKRVLVTVKVVAPSRSTETLVFGGTLRVTANHPLFANGVWKPAGTVRPDDEFVTSDGKKVRAGEPKRVQEPIDVYDLSVDGPHTFFAGGYLVHNKSIAAPPPGDLTRTLYYILWPEEMPKIVNPRPVGNPEK